jgi:hypothetical protein
MGSTTFGDVNPAMTGLTGPATFKIDRAGHCHVRIDGSA